MQKTVEIQLQELREQIAVEIEKQAFGIAETPFNNGFAHAVFLSAAIARGQEIEII